MIVGTFSPEIEIWNLDSENCEPVAVLGEAQDPKKMAKKGKKTLQVESISQTTHTDAIMSLSLNPFQKEYLLSGSADKTVRIWDLDDIQCKATYSNLHTDKVQAVRWNKKNEQLFASGGYDGRLCLQDVRAEGKGSQYLMNKKLYKDIESLQWHP